MKCTVTGQPYQVFGYKGKQVRDNIHSADLIAAFYEFYQDPEVAAVYNIGGGRESNCSMLEAIHLCQEIADRELQYSYAEDNRIGDHIWYISDLTKFKQRYTRWSIQYNIRGILRDIYATNVEKWVQL
jgi:CDP-paratose 2-epimerase